MSSLEAKTARIPVKVGFISGSLTHQRHMQIYEGFDPRYEIIAIGTRKYDLGESDITLPQRRLNSVHDLLSRIPKMRHRVPFTEQQYFFGFEKAMSDIDILFPGGSLMLFSYQCIELKRKTGVRVVLMDLENVPFAYSQFPAKRLAERRAVLDECDAIIATTEQVKRCMMMEGVPEEKIRCIHFGTRTDTFSPGPKKPEVMKELGVTENDIVVLYTGEFSWRKGAPTVLYAAKCFQMDRELSGAPVKFVFMGSGAAGMRSQAESIGLSDKVIVHDWIGFDKMPDVYRCADIIVVPSIPVPSAYEQGSCVMHEGGSTGRTMVVSQAGAMPDLLGDAGLYFPPADYWSLYLTLKDLVRDDGKREDYGRRVRDHALAQWDSCFTREKTAKVFDEILNNV